MDTGEDYGLPDTVRLLCIKNATNFQQTAEAISLKILKSDFAMGTLEKVQAARQNSDLSGSCAQSATLEGSRAPHTTSNLPRVSEP